MNKSITEQTKLNYRLIRQRLNQAGIVALALILLTVLFIVLVMRKADAVKAAKLQATQSALLNARRAQAKKLLQQYQLQDKLFRQIFPNERTIATFVEQTENIASLSAERVEFNFDSEKPRKAKNQYAYLSYTLRLTTDLNGLLVFLDRFERLPYISAIRLIDVQNLLGFDKKGDYVLKAIIYVEEPFSA